MMHAAASAVLEGGCDRVLVMPNTSPPISSFADAQRYHKALRGAEERVDYLMTLYLNESLTRVDLSSEMSAAARGGETCAVVGVKCYPKGVTTNSATGVESFEPYRSLFAQMERCGLSLHIHAEVPNENVMTAEASFLPRVEQIARDFPRLRIVVEHVSTAESVEVVKRHENIGATITAHHLRMVSSDVLRADGSVQQPHSFCKPIAKTAADRESLRAAAVSGHQRFFFGSDSAPHPRRAKKSDNPPAGCYTSPVAMPMLLETFDELGCLDRLEDFSSKFGSAFLGLPMKKPRYLRWKRERETLEAPPVTFCPEISAEEDLPELFLRSLRFSVC
eukprot:Polyplicarium_translucidae@DN3239_c0_g1_i8.p1